MTSDHLPICGFAPNPKAAIVNSLSSERKLLISKEKVPQFIRVVSQWLPPIPTLSTVEETEKFAQDICLALTNSLKAVGKRSNKKSGRRAPWWTPECKFAHIEYQEAAEESERVIRAKKFRSVVASAKREHWKRRIENMKSSNDAYKLMRWAAPRHPSFTPPLRYEGRFIADQLERAVILRDCLLSRFSVSDDLPPCTKPGEAHIPWSDEVTELEVKTCTIRSGNTSPGADGISVELLATCWENIELHVTQLFRACLRLGYHPNCFKLAEIVFLPKPRRDSSSVKGWRPIALLSCLGKGLERLLAKRMSHLAIITETVGR